VGLFRWRWVGSGLPSRFTLGVEYGQAIVVLSGKVRSFAREGDGDAAEGFLVEQSVPVAAACEVSVAKIRLLELCAAEIRASKVCRLQPGLLEASVSEVAAVEVSRTEVRFREIGVHALELLEPYGMEIRVGAADARIPQIDFVPLGFSRSLTFSSFAP
jgi:hypothetical protein